MQAQVHSMSHQARICCHCLANESCLKKGIYVLLLSSLDCTWLSGGALLLGREMHHGGRQGSGALTEV